MLQASNILFIIFNTAAGFSQSSTQIILLRALSGLGGAGPLSLGGGLLNDCFTPEERTTMITVYALPAMLSSVVGPILGAICETLLDWRWTFWIVSIVSVLLQVLCFITVHETYKPALERRRDRAQRKKEQQMSTFTLAAELLEDISNRLRENMPRPVKMLITHPIVQLLALYNAVTYGLMFLTISSLEHLWTKIYHQPLILASLNYCALGAGMNVFVASGDPELSSVILPAQARPATPVDWGADIVRNNVDLSTGLIVGSQICRHLNKKVGVYMKSRDPEGLSRPEARIPMIAVGSVIAPIGLLWYGWSSQKLAFPLIPDLGIFVFGIGIITILNCTSLYLVDTYKQTSASATGAVSILRSLAGFSFPLFSSTIFETLGQGWGNTVLASVSIALGWPIPLLLWRFGKAIREKQADL